MMEGSTGKGLDFSDGSPTEEELHAVKNVVASFLTAMKNYALYPEDHTICRNSIANVSTHLDAFLRGHGNLRFNVEKDRLLFRGEVVHQGPAKEENVAFLLFRDGLQWLEFQQGIEPREITGFFKILNRYKILDDEAEGDLVTALWEPHFPHLRYESTDVLWEAEPLIDFSLVRVVDEEHRGTDQQDEEKDTSVSMAVSTKDRPLWQMTPEEMKNLRQMVLEEERRDSTEDVFDVLVVILKQEREQEEFATILAIMKEEFRDALAQGKFQFALKFLTSLHEIRRSCKTERPWALPLLNHFFIELSSPQVLNVLPQVWPTQGRMDPDQIKALRRVLLLLPPEAIVALGPILLETHSSLVQRQLMVIIGSLAQRDLHLLERLLDRPEEILVQRLVYILGHLKGEKPARLLLKMIQHSSALVRKEALTALVVRDPQALQKVFHLIEDASDAIRRLMLKYLGQRRSTTAERLLLDYLEQRRFRRGDPQHLLPCYEAIGRCGSSRSVPFLRKALLDRGWIPGSGRSLHRHGAAVALMALGTEEAHQILQKASRSLFPTVRYAYRKAVAGNKGRAEAKR